MADDLLGRMFAAAESQNQRSRKTAGPPPSANGTPSGDRPGDLFNASAVTWSDILIPHGWQLVKQFGADEEIWRRPGKDQGISATAGHCRNDRGESLLRVFSTNAMPLEAETAYSKFAAYTVLNHRGDYTAAAKDLAAKGYGTQTETFQINTDGAIVPPKGPSAKFDPFSQKGQWNEEPEYWPHASLMTARFSPQPWLVDGLIMDESLTILGGRQKVGKSWLGLQIAQSVASGEQLFGKDVEQGDVIYLAIEDGARRLQDRLLKQKAKMDLPIVWYTRFPKLDEGGTKLLTEICARRPRLIIIDTLAAMKSGKVDEQSSGPMGDLGNLLRRLAQHYRLSILIVHHHGKSVTLDPCHDLRGSSALGAAADVLLGMYRVRRNSDTGDMDEAGQQADPEDDTPSEFWLKGMGRDIEELTLPVMFGAHTDWKWRIADRGTHDKRRHKGQDTRAAIITAIQSFGRGMSQSQIEMMTGINQQTLSSHLASMVREGVLSVNLISNPETKRLNNVYTIRSDND